MAKRDRMDRSGKPISEPNKHIENPTKSESPDSSTGVSGPVEYQRLKLTARKSTHSQKQQLAKNILHSLSNEERARLQRSAGQSTAATTTSLAAAPFANGGGPSLGRESTEVPGSSGPVQVIIGNTGMVLKDNESLEAISSKNALHTGQGVAFAASLTEDMTQLISQGKLKLTARKSISGSNAQKAAAQRMASRSAAGRDSLPQPGLQVCMALASASATAASSAQVTDEERDLAMQAKRTSSGSNVHKTATQRTGACREFQSPPPEGIVASAPGLTDNMIKLINQGKIKSKTRRSGESSSSAHQRSSPSEGVRETAPSWIDYKNKLLKQGKIKVKNRRSAAALEDGPSSGNTSQTSRPEVTSPRHSKTLSSPNTGHRQGIFDVLSTTGQSNSTSYKPVNSRTPSSSPRAKTIKSAKKASPNKLGNELKNLLASPFLAAKPIRGALKGVRKTRNADPSPNKKGNELKNLLASPFLAATPIEGDVDGVRRTRKTDTPTNKPSSEVKTLSVSPSLSVKPIKKDGEGTSKNQSTDPTTSRRGNELKNLLASPFLAATLIEGDSEGVRRTRNKDSGIQKQGNDKSDLAGSNLVTGSVEVDTVRRTPKADTATNKLGNELKNLLASPFLAASPIDGDTEGVRRTRNADQPISKPGSEKNSLSSPNQEASTESLQNTQNTESPTNKLGNELKNLLASPFLAAAPIEGDAEGVRRTRNADSRNNSPRAAMKSSMGYSQSDYDEVLKTFSRGGKSNRTARKSFSKSRVDNQVLEMFRSSQSPLDEPEDMNVSTEEQDPPKVHQSIREVMDNIRILHSQPKMQPVVCMSLLSDVQIHHKLANPLQISQNDIQSPQTPYDNVAQASELANSESIQVEKPRTTEPKELCAEKESPSNVPSVRSVDRVKKKRNHPKSSGGSQSPVRGDKLKSFSETIKSAVEQNLVEEESSMPALTCESDHRTSTSKVSSKKQSPKSVLFARENSLSRSPPSDVCISQRHSPKQSTSPARMKLSPPVLEAHLLSESKPAKPIQRKQSPKSSIGLHRDRSPSLPRDHSSSKTMHGPRRLSPKGSGEKTLQKVQSPGLVQSATTHAETKPRKQSPKPVSSPRRGRSPGSGKRTPQSVGQQARLAQSKSAGNSPASVPCSPKVSPSPGPTDGAQACPTAGSTKSSSRHNTRSKSGSPVRPARYQDYYMIDNISIVRLMRQAKEEMGFKMDAAAAKARKEKESDSKVIVQKTSPQSHKAAEEQTEAVLPENENPPDISSSNQAAGAPQESIETAHKASPDAPSKEAQEQIGKATKVIEKTSEKYSPQEKMDDGNQSVESVIEDSPPSSSVVDAKSAPTQVPPSESTLEPASESTLEPPSESIQSARALFHQALKKESGFSPDVTARAEEETKSTPSRPRRQLNFSLRKEVDSAEEPESTAGEDALSLKLEGSPESVPKPSEAAPSEMPDAEPSEKPKKEVKVESTAEKNTNLSELIAKMEGRVQASGGEEEVGDDDDEDDGHEDIKKDEDGDDDEEDDEEDDDDGGNSSDSSEDDSSSEDEEEEEGDPQGHQGEANKEEDAQPSAEDSCTPELQLQPSEIKEEPDVNLETSEVKGANSEDAKAASVEESIEDPVVTKVGKEDLPPQSPEIKEDDGEPKPSTSADNYDLECHETLLESPVKPIRGPSASGENECSSAPVTADTCEAKEIGKEGVEDNADYKIFEKPTQRKGSAFVSTELEDYLEKNAELKSLLTSDVFKKPDVPTKYAKSATEEEPPKPVGNNDTGKAKRGRKALKGKTAQEVSSLQETDTSPDFDDVEGLTFMSFASEEALQAHLFAEEKAHLGVYDIPLLKAYKERLGSIGFNKNAPKYLRDRERKFRSYEKIFIKELGRVEKQVYADAVGKSPTKTNDITKIKGWKKKFVSTDDVQEQMSGVGKLHWKTEDSLLKRMSQQELKEKGLALKKKRRKLRRFTHKKSCTTKEKDQFGEDVENEPDGESFEESQPYFSVSLMSMLTKDSDGDVHVAGNQAKTKPGTHSHPLLRNKASQQTFDKTLPTAMPTETVRKRGRPKKSAMMAKAISSLKHYDSMVGRKKGKPGRPAKRNKDVVTTVIVTPTMAMAAAEALMISPSKPSSASDHCDKPGCRYSCVCHLFTPPTPSPSENYAEADPPELANVLAPSQKKCSKEYCRLGCICDSMEVGIAKGHCGKPECMFECQCRTDTDLRIPPALQRRSQRIPTRKRRGSGSFVEWSSSQRTFRDGNKKPKLSRQRKQSSDGKGDSLIFFEASELYSEQPPAAKKIKKHKAPPVTEAPPAGDHRNNMPMLISSIAKDKKVIHKKEKDGTIKKQTIHTIQHSKSLDEDTTTEQDSLDIGNYTSESTSCARTAVYIPIRYRSMNTSEHLVSAKDPSEHGAQESVTIPRIPEMMNQQEYRITAEPFSYQQSASSRLGLNQKNIAKAPDPVSYRTDTLHSKSTFEHPVSAIVTSEHETQRVTSPRTPEMTNLQASRIATEPLSYQQTASSRLGLNQENVANSPKLDPQTMDSFNSEGTSEHTVTARDKSEHETQESVTSPRIPEMMNQPETRITAEPSSYQQTASFRLGLNQENVANSPDPVPQTTDTFRSKSTSEHTVTAKDTNQHESVTSPRTSEMMNPQENRITTEPSSYQQTASSSFGLPVNLIFVPHNTTDTFHSKNTYEHPVLESVTRTPAVTTLQASRIATEQQAAHYRLGLQQKNVAKKPDPPPPTYLHETFRKQMVLLQRKGNSEVVDLTGDEAVVKKNKSNLPHLLKISCNCNWTPIRSQLLNIISELADEGYPEVQSFKISTFNVAILPWEEEPHEVPKHLHGTLPMFMHSINIQVHLEKKRSAAAQYKVSAEPVNQQPTPTLPPIGGSGLQGLRYTVPAESVNQLHAQTSPPVGISGLQGLQISGKIDNLRSTYVFSRKIETSDQDMSKCGMRSIDNNDNSSAKDTDKNTPSLVEDSELKIASCTSLKDASDLQRAFSPFEQSSNSETVVQDSESIIEKQSISIPRQDPVDLSSVGLGAPELGVSSFSSIASPEPAHIGESSIKQEPISGLGTSSPDSKTTSPSTGHRTLADDQITHDALSSSHQDKPDAAPDQEIGIKTRDLSPSPSAQTLDESSTLCSTAPSGTPVSAADLPSSSSVETTGDKELSASPKNVCASDQALDSSIAPVDQELSPSDQPSSSSVSHSDEAVSGTTKSSSVPDQPSSSSMSHSDEAVSGTTKSLSVPDQPSSSSMSHSEQELSDQPKSASGKSSNESIPSKVQDENIDESASISHEENRSTSARSSDSSPREPVQTTSPVCLGKVNSDSPSQDGTKSNKSAEVVSELVDCGHGDDSSLEKNGKESAETEVGCADSGSLETISKPDLENRTQQDGPSATEVSESQESVHLSEDGVRSSSGVDEDGKKVPQSCVDSATTTVSSDTRTVSISSQPQQGGATSQSIIGQCDIRDTIPQTCEQMGLAQSKGQLEEPNYGGSGVSLEKTTSKSPLMVDNVSLVGTTAFSTDPSSIPSAAVSETGLFTTSKAAQNDEGSSSPDSMATSENDKLVGSVSVSPSDSRSGAQEGTNVSWSTSSKPISAPSVHAPTPSSKQAADLVMKKAGDGEFKPCQRKLQIGPDTQIVKDPVSSTITPHVDSEAVTTLTSSAQQDGTVTSKTSLQQVSTSVSPSTSSTPLPAGIVRRNSLTTQSANTVHETATRKPVEMKPNVVLNAPIVRGPLRPLRAPVPATPIIGHMLHNGVRIPIQLFPVACADGQVGMTFSPPAGIGMQGAPLRPAIVQVLPPQPGTPACVVPAQPLSTNKTSPKDKLNAVPITTFPSSITTSPSATVSAPAASLQSAGKNKNLHPFIMPIQPGTTTPGVNSSPTSATVSTPIVALQGNAQSATKNKNTVPLILPFPQGTTTTGVNLPSVAGTISIPYSALKGNTVISGTTTSGVNLSPTSATVSTPLVSLQSAGKNKNTVPLILPLPSVSGTVSIPYSALKGNTVISPKATVQSGPQVVAPPGMINLVIDMKDKAAQGNKDLSTKQRPSVSTVTASLNAPKLVPVSNSNSSIPSSIGDSNFTPTALSTTVAASDTKTIEKPSVSKATTFDQKGVSDRSLGSGPATMQRLSIQGSTVQRLSIQGDSICRTMSHLSPIQGQFRPLGVSPQTAGVSEPVTVAPPSDNLKAAGETSDRIKVTLPLRRGSVDKCLLSSSSTRTGAVSPNTARASSPSCVSGVLDQLKSLNDKAVRRRSFSPTSLPFTVVTPGGEEMKQSKISRKSTSPSSVSMERGGNDAVDSLESVSSSGHRVGLSAFTPISSDPAGPSTLEKSSSKSSESHQDVDIKGLATNIYRAAKTASKILQEAGKGPGSSASFGNSLRRRSLDSSGDLVQKEGPPAKKAKMDENVSYSIQNKSSWDDECPDIGEPDTKRLKLDKALTNAEESGTPDFLARNEPDHTLPKIVSVQSLAGQLISTSELGSDLAGALKPEGIQRLTGRRKSKLEVRPDGMMPQQRSWPGSPLSSRSGTPTHDALSGSAQFSSYSDDWDDEDEESIIDVGEDMEIEDDVDIETLEVGVTASDRLRSFLAARPQENMKRNKRKSALEQKTLDPLEFTEELVVFEQSRPGQQMNIPRDPTVSSGLKMVRERKRRQDLFDRFNMLKDALYPDFCAPDKASKQLLLDKAHWLIKKFEGQWSQLQMTKQNLMMVNDALIQRVKELSIMRQQNQTSGGATIPAHSSGSPMKPKSSMKTAARLIDSTITIELDNTPTFTPGLRNFRPSRPVVPVAMVRNINAKTAAQTHATPSAKAGKVKDKIVVVERGKEEEEVEVDEEEKQNRSPMDDSEELNNTSATEMLKEFYKEVGL